MIESYKELKLDDAKSPEEMDQILKDKLGIGFSECAQALSDSISNKVDELLEDMFNISPYGDYSSMIEDSDEMKRFLLEESSKVENWKIQFIEVRKDKDKLMELVFFNESVDDGDILKGFVFLGFSGIIRHAFVQVNN